VKPELKELIERDATAKDQTMSEVARKILAGHYQAKAKR
jgi:hypothetical protein